MSTRVGSEREMPQCLPQHARFQVTRSTKDRLVKGRTAAISVPDSNSTAQPPAAAHRHSRPWRDPGPQARELPQSW